MVLFLKCPGTEEDLLWSEGQLDGMKKVIQYMKQLDIVKQGKKGICCLQTITATLGMLTG